jgi:hypothetical protein
MGTNAEELRVTGEMAADVTQGWEHQFLVRIAAYWEQARPVSPSAVTDR